MEETVLVPVDGSPLSFRALRYALTEFPEARITAFHVVDLFEAPTGFDAESSYEPLMGSEEWHRRVKERTDDLFEEARTIASDHDSDIVTDSEVGDPQRVIPDVIAEEGFDHVVLGAHGRDSPERPLVGRVTEAVVYRTSVPVTIVR